MANISIDVFVFFEYNISVIDSRSFCYNPIDKMVFVGYNVFIGYYVSSEGERHFTGAAGT